MLPDPPWLAEWQAKYEEYLTVESEREALRILDWLMPKGYKIYHDN